MSQIKPYQFEPSKRKERKKKSRKQTDEESEWEDVEEWELNERERCGVVHCYEDELLETQLNEAKRIEKVVTSWCNCGFCERMPVNRECICYSEYPEVKKKLENVSTDLNCITQHPEFRVVCLHKAILWTALCGLNDREGAWIADSQEDCSNKSYRYASYRQFTYFIYSKLGRHVRRIILACVVTAICNEYPEASGIYVNFVGDDDGADGISEIVEAWEYVEI